MPPPNLSLELIRSSIRDTVKQHGANFKRAAPHAITISLVGAALLPVALGTLPLTGPVLAMLGLAGGLGQGLLGNWLSDFIQRTKREREAKHLSEDEIRNRLEAELRARWETGGPGGVTAAWRMEMSQMLQANGGVTTALVAATGDVKLALAESFQAMGQQFQEFGWLMTDMSQTLADMRAQQDQQLALQQVQVDLAQKQVAIQEQLKEILQRQQASAAQAGEGLQALSVLIQRSPAMRGAIVAFRTDFQAALTQVAILGDYKDLHDLLHSLQFNVYNVIIKAAARLPADETALDDLQDYLLSLEDILEHLREVAGRAAVTAADTAWIRDIATARDELRRVTEHADPALLRQAVWRLNRALSIQPARVNTRLTEAARALRLSALVEALTLASQHLSGPGLDPDKVRQFQIGLEALGRLSQNLPAGVDSHDQWQGVDVELRRIEALIEPDLSELQMSWPDLKAIAEPLYQALSDEWAVGLSREAEALDEALIADDPVKTRRAFRNYRNRAGRHFFQVDSDLRKLCGELRPIGEPLTLVLRMIE